MQAKTNELPPEILDKIQHLLDKQTSAMALQDDFGLFIPPSAALKSNSSNIFDLTGAVNDFIEGNKVVLLLLGESGSGKSFFGQTLIKKKSESFKPGNPIPLFISLPMLENPITQLMQEFLESNGFSKDEIQYLRTTQKYLLVFDAYDEINTYENLYIRNNMEEWSAKIVVTCRHAHLTQDRNYQRFFKPYKMKKLWDEAFQELFVAPFVHGQIDQYIIQYLSIKSEELRNEIWGNDGFSKEWLEPKTYLYWIEKIPGLQDLTTQPFLLRITMDVLRKIVAEFQSLKDGNERYCMTRAKLYDIFVSSWFTRQENKLISAGQPVSRTYQKDCLAFAKLLAKKMHDKKVQVVYFEDASLLDDNSTNPNAEWAMFFSDQMVPEDRNNQQRCDARINARKACLLKQVGECQWSFIHLSLRDYFHSLTIVGPQNRAAPPKRSDSMERVMPEADSKHRVVGRFCLMNRFDRAEANELMQEEGIKIRFDLQNDQQKFILGQGHFGKVRIARNLISQRFAGVKKIRGRQAIQDSQHEAEFQRQLEGLPNIMPIWDSQLIQSKKTGENKLLQFMPLAGFGNGALLFNLLPQIKNSEVKRKFLIHILRSILIGFKSMHGRRIYHLDFKPDNFVLDSHGNLFIIDFGCAHRNYSNKDDAILVEGKGHQHYFSPERLAYWRQKFINKLPPSETYELAENYDAGKADVWAVGISLLELFLENDDYISGCNSDLIWKLKNWNSTFFHQTFQNVLDWENASDNSLLGLIKVLLQTDQTLRPTAAQVLKSYLFLDPNNQLSAEELNRLMAELIELKDNPDQFAQKKDQPFGEPDYLMYDYPYRDESQFYGHKETTTSPRDVSIVSSNSKMPTVLNDSLNQTLPDHYSPVSLNEDVESDHGLKK